MTQPIEVTSIDDIKHWLKELRVTYSAIRAEAEDILQRDQDEEE